MTRDDTMVRDFVPTDRPVLTQLMRRSFPCLIHPCLQVEHKMQVAEQDGRVVGGIMLKVFSMDYRRKGGVILLLFTAPEARGQGVATALVDAGMNFFAEQGCDELFTYVEGYNTASSNRFAHHGFSILSPGQQFRRYGLSTFSLWWKTSRINDLGHFFWVWPPVQDRDRPLLQWGATVLLNAIAVYLVWWRRGEVSGVDPVSFLLSLLIIGLFLAGRSLSMDLAARWQGLRTRHRIWETAFPMSFLVAVLFSGYFPVPGNQYPASKIWHYSEMIKPLGRMALAGVLVVLMLTYACLTLRWAIDLPDLAEDWIRRMQVIGSMILLFDAGFPFFPFVSFNGKRLWDWNRYLWGAIAVLVAIVFSSQ